MKDFLKIGAALLILVFLFCLWVVILLHPVYVAIHKDNIIWLLLYIAVIPECIVGVVITKIFGAILESMD